MITVISGTNRPNSNSLKIAEKYTNKINEMYPEEDPYLLDLCNIKDLSNNLYGKIDDDWTFSIETLIYQSDKFIFIIPEYNGSFPGMLKVFMDCLIVKFGHYHPQFAALVGISSGKFGNIRGVAHFQEVCNYMNLEIISKKVYIPNINKELESDLSIYHEKNIKSQIKYLVGIDK